MSGSHRSYPRIVGSQREPYYDPTHLTELLGFNVTHSLQCVRVVGRTLGLVLMLAHEEDDAQTAIIEPILRDALVQREATMTAWERFCAQVGVKPESVATTIGPSDGDFWWLVENTIHGAGIRPELDEQRVQERLTRLVELWTERTAT